MPSYRLSEFLPAAVFAASRSVSRPVGRGIDEMERQDFPVSMVDAVGGDDSNPLMLGAAATDLAAAAESARTQRGLASSFPFSSDPVDLSEVEDRRLFHPEGRQALSSARTVRGSKTRLDASSLPQMAGRVRYSVGHASVITCIRRRIRREVIFAKGRSGANVFRYPNSMEVCE